MLIDNVRVSDFFSSLSIFFFFLLDKACEGRKRLTSRKEEGKEEKERHTHVHSVMRVLTCASSKAHLNVYLIPKGVSSSCRGNEIFLPSFENSFWPPKCHLQQREGCSKGENSILHRSLPSKGQLKEERTRRYSFSNGLKIWKWESIQEKEEGFSPSQDYRESKPLLTRKWHKISKKT